MTAADQKVEATWSTVVDPVAGVPQAATGISMTPDGKVLEIVFNQSTSWQMGDPSSLATYDPKTGKTAVLVAHGERTPGTNIDTAAIDSRYVAWADTTSADLYLDPWTLRSKDLQTGKVRTLAEAPSTSQMPAALFNHGAQPIIYEDNVFIVGNSDQLDHRGFPLPSVFEVPIDGSGGLREFIHGADMPQLSGTTLMYRKDDRVYSRDLSDTSSKVLIDRRWTGAHADSWAFAEGTFASMFEASDGTNSMHIVPANGPAVEITGIKRAYGAINATSRWVGVAVGGGSGDDPQTNYLYDIKKRRLSIVKPQNTYVPAKGSGADYFFASRKGMTGAPDRITLYTLD